jgi:hypothetical protein
MPSLIRWLREPLVHFVVLGGLTFLAYDLARADAPDPDRIVVTRAKQSELVTEFEEIAGRPPSAEEREHLIDRFVDEELVYREGLALGLDRGDPVVRRRVIRKMEFVQTSYDVIAEPSDEELEAFLEANPERYAADPRYDIEQIFVAARDGVDAEAEAARILGALEGGAPSSGMGDRHTRGRKLSIDHVRKAHGDALADAIPGLEPERWYVVEAERGFFVVRIDAMHAARTPPLSEIRNRLTRDWKDARRRERAQEVIDGLRTKYEIVVEGA